MKSEKAAAYADGYDDGYWGECPTAELFTSFGRDYLAGLVAGSKAKRAKEMA